MILFANKSGVIIRALSHLFAVRPRIFQPEQSTGKHCYSGDTILGLK